MSKPYVYLPWFIVVTFWRPRRELTGKLVGDISVYCVVLKMSEVENPETDVAQGIQQTGEKADESKLEKEKAFVALKRQKCLRKSEMTKIRHHMEKFCIAPKDVVAIEKDIEQLWSLLETTLEVLDELCIVYLEKGEEKNREAAMEEAQSLESEIQAAIEKAHEAIKS